MALEITITSPGESITEADLASWLVEDGDLVSKNQEVGEIESEKATLPLIAEESGKITILVKEGETVKVGDVVATIDTSVEVEQPPEKKESSARKEPEVDKKEPEEEKEPEEKETKEAAPARVENEPDAPKVKMTPVAREMMEKEGLSVEEIINGLRKITSNDVKQVLQQEKIPSAREKSVEVSRETERKKVSQLRRKISERLVAVKNETAMLTTFNEADMSVVMDIRKRYQEQFTEKHGIKLGFMSFFTKAVTEALKSYPAVNSYLEGEELVTPRYYDIGIAVQSDKGLMVPVIKNTETLSLPEIEKQIADLASRARKARLGIEEMSGGTFTISNGGIYGSMLSTPILNPPQSAILGMHNILERPVAIRGKVEIRPMMYLALSYDHRVIDGRDSVGFLRTVKEFIEEPARMIFGSDPAEAYLLEL
ncbi:MAG: 2-oxoglutarate dehydrogenase complex dihydrolipoyllysine-residue succinyltransferase [Bacteroidales bacterium]